MSIRTLHNSERPFADQMEQRGVDMSWYRRGRKRLETSVPLDDDMCSNGSIYWTKADGSLWTIELTYRMSLDERIYSASPYRKVRQSDRELSEQYVCMHSRMVYQDINKAVRHTACG